MLTDAHQRAAAGAHVAVEDHPAGAQRARPSSSGVRGGVARVEPALLHQAIGGIYQVDARVLPSLEPGVVDPDAPLCPRRCDTRQRPRRTQERESVAFDLDVVGLDLDGGLPRHSRDVPGQVIHARRGDDVLGRHRPRQALHGDTRFTESLVGACDLVVHVLQRRPVRGGAWRRKRACNTGQGRGAGEAEASDQKTAVGIACHDGPPLSQATLPGALWGVAMKSSPARLSPAHRTAASP